MSLVDAKKLPARERWADRPQRQRVTFYAAVGLAALLVFTLFASDYWAFLGTSAVIQALLTASVGILFARARMLSLCPLTFAAAACWLSGWLTTNGLGNFFIMIPAAMILAAVLGLAVGLLALRLRGMNLAVATVAVASAGTVFLSAAPIPGLQTGIPVARPGFASSERGYFILCTVILIVVFLAMWAILRSRLGSSWAMLSNERAAAAAGTNVMTAKLSAFAISAVLASVAGVLMSGQQGLVDTTVFSVGQNFQVVVVAIFVGAGYLEGAVLSGIVPVVLGEIFLRLGLPTDIPTIFFGVGAVQILAENPGGISADLRLKRRKKRAARMAKRGALPAAMAATDVTDAAPTPDSAAAVLGKASK